MRRFVSMALLVPILAFAGPKGGGHSSGNHSSSHGYPTGTHSSSVSAGSASHSKSTHATSPAHSSSKTHATPSAHTTSHTKSGTSPTKTTKPSSTGSPKRDSHRKIERSAQAKNDFRKKNPCPSTGRTSGACPGYEVDHRTPLACGGSDSPSNMQWLTKSANRSKGAAGCKTK